MLRTRAGRRLVLVGAVALAFGALGGGCGDDESPADDAATSGSAEQTTTEPTATTTGSTTAPPTTDEVVETTEVEVTTTTAAEETTTTAAPVSTTTVNVYWGWTVLNPATGSPERIGAGARDVEADTPVRNSLEAMFDGPNSTEQEIGMVTSIPDGTTVLGIAVDDTTATVDLSAEFEAPGGSLEETMRLAQVVFAVTQFDGFDRVAFHIDGEPRDTILSHGFEVGDGLTRDDFPNVRARIMIEEPFPGAEVTNPLVIRGESNTFEANVRYAVTVGGGDGVILTEGFTTATAGSGTWGTFEISVDLEEFADSYQPGPGSIIMWEDSPQDGSQVDVVEIPIILPDL